MMAYYLFYKIFQISFRFLHCSLIVPGVIVDRMFAGPLHSFDKDDQLDFSPCGPTYSQKKERPK